MGETITWVVATIVVVVILGISISILSLNDDSRRMIIPVTSDLFAAKSLTGYLSTDNIYDELSAEGVEDFSEESGNLASSIFTGLYDQEHLKIWAGFNFDRLFLSRESNNFFNVILIEGGHVNEGEISERIILNKDKSFEVYFLDLSKILY